MEQGTQEWLDMRLDKITASDAAVIMGCSPWNNVFDLWREKMRIIPPKRGNFATRKGLRLEAKARKAFERKMGKKFPAKVVLSESVSWRMSSFDGIADTGESLELKCANAEVRMMARNGKIPDYYMYQIQHHLMTKPIPKLEYYFVYDEIEDDGPIVEVEKDDKLIAQLDPAEADFWRRMREYDPPPNARRSDLAWKRQMKKVIRADQMRKKWSENYEKEKDFLIEIAGHQSAEGEGLKLTKSLCKGIIDYKNIPQLRGVDLEQFRKPEYAKYTISY